MNYLALMPKKHDYNDIELAAQIRILLDILSCFTAFKHMRNVLTENRQTEFELLTISRVPKSDDVFDYCNSSPKTLWPKVIKSAIMPLKMNGGE